jgi:hypothetical protein
LPVVSPASRSFFHIVRVQLKISLEEMRHIYHRLGAGRSPLWLSPTYELQVKRRQLCASTVIPDAQTAFAFLNGHRPVPGCSQLPLYIVYAAARSPHGTTLDCLISQSSSAKKVVRYCEFSEKFGSLEKHHVSNNATENAWFLSNLICLPGNGT